MRETSRRRWRRTSRSSTGARSRSGSSSSGRGPGTKSWRDGSSTARGGRGPGSITGSGPSWGSTWRGWSPGGRRSSRKGASPCDKGLREPLAGSPRSPLFCLQQRVQFPADLLGVETLVPRGVVDRLRPVRLAPDALLPEELPDLPAHGRILAQDIPKEHLRPDRSFLRHFRFFPLPEGPPIIAGTFLFSGFF